VDEDLVVRSLAIFDRVLSDGGDMTRAELKEALAAAGIAVTGPQLSHLTLRAEIDDVLTSGPGRGRLHTYMLLDARVGEGLGLQGDEALAELTRRYVRSHGPASERDFAWWSSLPLVQVRRGLQAVGDEVESMTVDDVAYWFDPTAPAGRVGGALMLQTFDEYVVAYRETRKVAYAEQPTRSMNPNSFTQPVVVDGQVVGTWRRKVDGARGAYVEIAAPTLDPGLLAAELARYERFVGAKHATVWVDADPTPSHELSAHPR
jgi:hypothetical protein